LWSFPPNSPCIPLASLETVETSMRLRSRRLVQNSGQALIEYALILALASLAIVSALMILQGSLGNTMQASRHQIDAAGGGRPGQPAGSETGAAGPPAPGGDGGYGDGRNGRK
jgi:Flp pilus assembly pilin Flp